jgi:hypothetical protein
MRRIHEYKKNNNGSVNNPSEIARSLEGTGSLGLLANLPDCLSGETGSTPV